MLALPIPLSLIHASKNISRLRLFFLTVSATIGHREEGVELHWKLKGLEEILKKPKTKKDSGRCVLSNAQ
uniref:Uncharacterized protein n=1 Tax=Rousettus aegyptiacus TaxID=9407 RepID=A0A7J8DI82_ROUAE|nr:hypothetical protein HJG63_008621 [Rousettus aegyptiacus]